MQLFSSIAKTPVQTFYNNLLHKLGGNNVTHKVEDEIQQVVFNNYDTRPINKEAGSWVEQEGYLFFDRFMVPHPAGFVADKGLYTYAEELHVHYNTIKLIIENLDIAIQELAKAVNDPVIVCSKSFKFQNLTKLRNGMTKQVILEVFKEYFNGTKSNDKAPLTVLFRNANELSKTAVEVDTLMELVSELDVSKINERINRLANLACVFNDEIVKITEEERPLVMTEMRDNVISPMAEWCEVLSIYLYQVNVLKVSFSDLEDHIKRISKK